MPTFSERYNYIEKPIQIENMTPDLRNRIWNIYRANIIADVVYIETNHLEELMDFFGKACTSINDDIELKTTVEIFYETWFNAVPWYRIYDFIEKYLSFLTKEDRKKESKKFNNVLEEENAGYRIVSEQVVPITDKNEIESIEKAQKSNYESVNMHLKKAMQLFSRRPQPDYENSIKESISAVEAMCCIITDSSGANATLGKTLKKLKDNGVYIHPAMENAFSSLYGYTSDENGIRHGGIDFSNAPAEDAKFMLVSCSAFVNYLIEKMRIIKQ